MKKKNIFRRFSKGWNMQKFLSWKYQDTWYGGIEASEANEKFFKLLAIINEQEFNLLEIRNPVEFDIAITSIKSQP